MTCRQSWSLAKGKTAGSKVVPTAQPIETLTARADAVKKPAVKDLRKNGFVLPQRVRDTLFDPTAHLSQSPLINDHQLSKPRATRLQEVLASYIEADAKELIVPEERLRRQVRCCIAALQRALGHGNVFLEKLAAAFTAEMNDAFPKGMSLKEYLGQPEFGFELRGNDMCVRLHRHSEITEYIHRRLGKTYQGLKTAQYGPANKGEIILREALATAADWGLEEELPVSQQVVFDQYLETTVRTRNNCRTTREALNDLLGSRRDLISKSYRIANIAIHNQTKPEGYMRKVIVMPPDAEAATEKMLEVALAPLAIDVLMDRGVTCPKQLERGATLILSAYEVEVGRDPSVKILANDIHQWSQQFRCIGVLAEQLSYTQDHKTPFGKGLDRNDWRR